MNKKIIALGIALLTIFAGIAGYWAWQHSLFYPTVNANADLTIDTRFPEQTTFSFTEGGDRYMDIMLLEPAEKLYNVWWWDFQENMSRCGSGADYFITSKPTDKNPYFMGNVGISNGCNIEKIFDFRVHSKNKTIDIFDENSKKYIPAKDWFLSAKTIDIKFSGGSGIP